jgi:hypothetical protein
VSGQTNNVIDGNTFYRDVTGITIPSGANSNLITRNHFIGLLQKGIDIGGNTNIIKDNDFELATFSTAGIQNTGTGNILDRGTTGGYSRLIAESTGTPAGTTTSFVITLSIPTGSRLLGCQLRVDTALTVGETWKADYSGGSTTSIAPAGQAVAKNTKINKMHVDEITTNTTNVTITRDAGNFTNGVGVIRAIVYYELFTAMADAA